MRDHVCKLRDGFDSIAAELRHTQDKRQDHQHLESYKAREESVKRLDTVMTQLAQIIASLGVPGGKHHDGSASIGELPFTTHINPRGSRLNRVRHMTEIVTALAKSIEGPAPKVAQELENMATEMKSPRLRRGL